MYSKHHTVIITNILMTSHLIECQIYDIVYNLSIRHYPPYIVCTV